ncbi:MAG TPA: TMEM165/GDT1 family protein, partial [Allosphingosinicella sp.]|nr:TMEM165/GDT1 family protein [Allosphingosinicella sp.]
MEPLLTAFAAALLGGWADKTQATAAMLAERYRSRALLPALVLAVAANSIASAVGGSLLRLEISVHAATLLLAVALAFAGAAGLIGERARQPTHRGGAFLTALVSLFAAGWGDKTQYLVAALAAYYANVPLIAAGAFVGTLAVTLPAAVGGKAFTGAAPLKPLRIVFGLVFLIAAGIVVV